MDEKFQSDTKELDEKFAAIPENLKKRYDMHRFIRRVIYRVLFVGGYNHLFLANANVFS